MIKELSSLGYVFIEFNSDEIVVNSHKNELTFF